MFMENMHISDQTFVFIINSCCYGNGKTFLKKKVMKITHLSTSDLAVGSEGFGDEVNRIVHMVLLWKMRIAVRVLQAVCHTFVCM